MKDRLLQLRTKLVEKLGHQPYIDVVLSTSAVSDYWTVSYYGTNIDDSVHLTAPLETILDLFEAHIDAIPTPEERNRLEFVKQLTKTIEMGEALNIEVQPLREIYYGNLIPN